MAASGGLDTRGPFDFQIALFEVRGNGCGDLVLKDPDASHRGDGMMQGSGAHRGAVVRCPAMCCAEGYLFDQMATPISDVADRGARNARQTPARRPGSPAVEDGLGHGTLAQLFE